MNDAVQIQLSVEEAMQYAQFDAELTGFVSGVQAAHDYARRQKINQMLAARKAPSSDTTEPLQEASREAGIGTENGTESNKTDV